MNSRRSVVKRTTWLSAALGTVLCGVGTILVFVTPVIGFALLFVSFCVYSVIPFLAFGLLGSGPGDGAPVGSAERESQAERESGPEQASSLRRGRGRAGDGNGAHVAGRYGRRR